MEPFFQQLTPRWFQRAHVYTGSIGPCFHDFRFRFVQDEKEQQITASLYRDKCFEAAEHVETQQFPWTEEGVESLKQWLEDAFQRWKQETLLQEHH